MSENLPMKTAMKFISCFTVLMLFHIYINNRKRGRSATPSVNLNKQLEQRMWKKIEQRGEEQKIIKD